MIPASCVDPTTVAAKALSTYTARRRRWLADPVAAESDSFTVSLHPPTEETVAIDPDRVVSWARTWRAHTCAGGVEWAVRRWPSFGTQQIPVRVVFTGASQIAAASGRAREWRTLVGRRNQLVAEVAPTALGFPASVASTTSRWELFDDADFDRLIAVLRWLLEHPTSGLLIRQLPIPGVDTKWVSGHRGLVEKLLGGARGDGDLGVRTAPLLREIAVLDRELLPGAPRVLATPLDQLATLPLQPDRVLILENREGLHALPDMTGTVALHGVGYIAHEFASIPWLAGTDVRYWGDLDSHGFAILNQLRHHLPQVRSLLMDRDTVERWHDLAVTEPKPATGTFTALTTAEASALELIREHRLRLEQERLPWPYVLDRLQNL